MIRTPRDGRGALPDRRALVYSLRGFEFLSASTPMGRAPTMLQHRIASRLQRWSPGIILAVYALVVLLGCVEHEWRPEWDSAIYVLAARSLAEGTGYSYLGSPFFLRPPGLSYVLSFLFHRDRGFDFGQINFLIMLSFVVAVVIVYLTLRRTEGQNRALAAVLLMATCPVFVVRFNWIQSDPPFLALLFASILLFDLAVRESRWGIGACFGGSLLLTAAAYLRTVGISLLPGVVLFLLVRQRGRKRLGALVPALVVPLLLAPWLQHARAAAAAAPRPSEQLLVFDYATASLHVDPGDPGSEPLSAGQWRQKITGNAALILRRLAACITGLQSGWICALVLAILLLGLVAALIRGPTLLEWHGAAYTAALLTFFDYNASLGADPAAEFSRLLLPLLPSVYAYLVGGLNEIRRRLPLGSDHRVALIRRHATAALVLSGLMFLNLAAAPSALNPQRTPLPIGTLGDLWNDYRRSAEWLRENTPDDAVIMTEMAPIVSLLSGRLVYTNRFPRAPGMLRRYRIDYVVSFWSTHPKFENMVAAAAGRTWVLPSHAKGASIRFYEIPKR
jgi:hypothetical protein